MSRRMLIPIDGSRGSSSVIPYAAELARSMGCRASLFLARPERHAKLPHSVQYRSAGQGGESGTASVGSPTADDARKANQQFVDRHTEEFQALGLETDR